MTRRADHGVLPARRRRVLSSVKRLGLASCLVFITSCASTSNAAVGGTLRSADVISRQEMSGKELSTAYDAIRHLRPGWLRRRAAPSLVGGSGYAAVFVDRVMANNGFETLHAMPIGDVSEIRFLSPADATTLFGTGHMAGAILLTTRRGGQ